MSSQSVNVNVQGSLARLLAVENITVHQGDYQTAFFDVKNRVLGLPTWNVKSKFKSDLLIGHEVGHALWTSLEDTEKFRKAYPHIPFSLINIVEDIRIERKIQDKYPGLISVFNKGYSEFWDDDFFGVKNTDPNKLSFPDRLNLKGKLNNLIAVRFSSDEEVILKRCRAAETFTEVVNIVVDIYEMLKKQAESNPQPQTKSKPAQVSKERSSSPKRSEPTDESFDSDEEVEEDSDESSEESGGESDGETQEESDSAETKSGGESAEESKEESESDAEESGDDGSDADGSSDDEESDSDSESQKDSESEKGGGGRGNKAGSKSADNTAEDLLNDSLKSQTQDAADKNLNEMHEDYLAYLPMMTPVKTDYAGIIPWKTVLASRSVPLTDEVHGFQRVRMSLEDGPTKAAWNTFKKESMKKIQVMIAEFDRRKAAVQYSRAEESYSGDIDVNKLHSYRFDDKIFRSVVKLKDAKNHGMMFFIDYSGSMSEDIYAVLEHTLNLTMFCKAVGIPFQVFGFTNPSYWDKKQQLPRQGEVSSRQFYLGNTSVFELLSSEMNKNEFELASRYLHCQVTHRYLYNSSLYESMSGTPLNETIIIAHHLVAAFKKRYAIEKMNVIILSDGQGCALQHGYSQTSNLRCRTSPTHYKVTLAGREVLLSRKSPNKQYSELIKNLRITLGCKVIGFFIGSHQRYIANTIVGACKEIDSDKVTDYKKISELTRTAKREGYVIIPGGFNFNSYFVISSRKMKIAQDSDFTSNVDTTVLTTSDRNKLAKDFNKFSQEKKNSRIILKTFTQNIS